MYLTDDEKAMRDGSGGAAVQKAMDLLVRYGEALGAERLVETRNVCATITSTTPFQRDFALKQGAWTRCFQSSAWTARRWCRSRSSRSVTSHLQLGFDPGQPERMGVSEDIVRFYEKSERHAAGLGAQIMNTCTPYQVGNIPTRGEQLRLDGVVGGDLLQLGARRAHQCRRPESTGAAMLTGRIPCWGYHLDEHRLGTHDRRARHRDRVGAGLGPARLLHRRAGAGPGARGPQPARHRPGAEPAAAQALRRRGPRRRGGVEMYHVVGVTPEALSLEQALGGRKPAQVLRYGEAERRATYETINATARGADIQYVSSAVRTTRSSRSGRRRNSIEGAQGASRLASCGSSRRAPSSRWPTATATPRSSRTREASS